jgi:flagellar basal body-associated protein FliL
MFWIILIASLFVLFLVIVITIFCSCMKDEYYDELASHGKEKTNKRTTPKEN